MSCIQYCGICKKNYEVREENHDFCEAKQKMNPTQPKDAEMDEKKEDREFEDKLADYIDRIYASNVYRDKSIPLGFYITGAANWAREKTKEDFQHILSEERARLEEAVDVFFKLDKLWFDPSNHGIACHACECNLFDETKGKHIFLGGDLCPIQVAHDYIIKYRLKSPGERDQPTEDKSGEKEAFEAYEKQREKDKFNNAIEEALASNKMEKK